MADSECDRVRISPEPIVQDELITFVSDPSAGAVSVFLGTYAAVHVYHQCITTHFAISLCRYY